MQRLPELTPLKEWSKEVLVNYHTAYRWARNGVIEARQLGTRWYVVGTGLRDSRKEGSAEESE